MKKFLTSTLALVMVLALLLPLGSTPVSSVLPVGEIAASAQATTTFAVFGDYGDGDTSGDPNEGYVASMVDGWSPDYILATGDCYYDDAGGSGTGQYDISTGQFYCNYLKDAATGTYCSTGGNAASNAFFASLGNHDYSDAESGVTDYLNYFTLPGAGYTNTSGNERYYDFVNGDIHFFALNSNSVETDGITSTSTQANWLQTQLGNSTSAWNVVFFHHAPYSTSSRHGDTADLQWPFASWGADVVFNGHVHNYERLESGGIPYFVSGWGGGHELYNCNAATTAGTSRHCYYDNYGSMRVTADSSVMTFEALSIDDGDNGVNGGEVIDTYQLLNGGTCTTIEVSVSQSSDDAEESTDDDSMYLDSTDLEMVDDADYAGLQIVGMRFQNVTVPPGATVQDAYLEFEARDDEDGATNLTFWAQDANNPGTFTDTAGDVSGRTKTTAYTSWLDVPSWSDGTLYQTPGLATAVQEVVDLGGWASGNAMVFIVDGDGERTAMAEDHSSGEPPKLVIEYCEAPDIGDDVWVDKDKDGVQDPNERSAGDVEVRLWSPGADGQIGGGDDSLVQTTTSVRDNSYGFTGVANGNYYLEFVQPASTSFSPRYATGATSPTGAGDDSDAGRSTGLTEVFSYSGTPLTDIDAGLTGGPTCYAQSDSSDTLKNDAFEDVLVFVDLLSGEGTYIGQAQEGVVDIEAIEWDPYNSVLIAADANDVGELDTSTGLFTPYGTISSCRLSDTTTATLSDFDGLAQDFTDQTWWVTERNPGGTDDNLDLLLQFQIDSSGPNPTVSLVQNTFGAGIDCVKVQVPSGNTALTDIDDIGFSGDGTLYGIANLNQTQSRVVVIDKTAPGAGNTTDLGEILFQASAGDPAGMPASESPITDVEGFSIGEDGRVLISTGQDADDGFDDSIYELDLTQNPIPGRFMTILSGPGRLTNAGDPDVSYEDYEGLTCYGVSQQEGVRLGAIGNYVWLDENADGYQDAGEDGIANVRVELYTPGDDGVLGTGDDVLYATTYTDAHGGYLFPDLTAGPYQVRIPSSNFGSGGALENMTQSTNPVNGGSDFGNQSLDYTITLGFGEENLTADFGYNWNPAGDVNDPPGNTAGGDPSGAATAAIGDRVWIDADGEGDQDPEEMGLPGVTVSLYEDADGDGLYNDAVDDPNNPGNPYVVTTDANGNYIFDGLPPGAYVVEVDPTTLPGGYTWTQTGDPDDFGVPATAPDDKTTTPVVLAPGDVFVNADFGYDAGDEELGSIGNTIWFDADADGVGPTINSEQHGLPSGTQDVSETDYEYGIAGVTVALIRDSNNDGIWDPDGADNTPGTADDEPLIATDTTNADGQYLFDGLLVTDGTGSDDYLVWVNDTDNVLGELDATYDRDGDSGGGSALQADSVLGLSRVQDLTTTPVTDQDFGYTAEGHAPDRGLIGDRIWLDANFDGVGPQGDGEAPGDDDTEDGIEGVVMQLFDPSTGPGDDLIYGTDDDSAVLLGTTVTDENGRYYFGDLDPNGSFAVQVHPANFATDGVLEGMDNYWDPDATDSPHASTVTLVDTSADRTNLAQDFGYAAPDGESGSIGNLVWEDLNANGVRDAAEPGIDGVTVDLYRDLNGNGSVDPGEPLIGTETTASGGSYNFTGLPAGDYVVDVTDTAGVLAGYWHSLHPTDPGGDHDDWSKYDPHAVTLGSGQNYVAADFGYYVDPGAVGNRVWHDSSGDGIQDAGEPGIDGVEVTLTIDYPDGTQITVVTLTADGGWYSFGNLLVDEDYRKAGGTGEPTYTITVDAGQDALTFYPHQTYIGVGSDETVDSNDPTGTDVQPVQGETDASSSNDSETIASYDFGFSEVSLAVESVVVDSFEAEWQENGVLLSWLTVSEINVLDFDIYRCGSLAGERVRINKKHIPAQAPGSPTGAAYDYLDDSAADGQTYYYWLYAFDNKNRETHHGPAVVWPHSIWLPVMARGQ